MSIQAWCKAHEEEQLALLKTLAAIPSPSHHEEQRAQFILNWLQQRGAQDARIDEAKNVVLPFGCEGRSGIQVYLAHTDVVFPDMTPLPVREEDGRLYAPGVGDDTANVCALMLCAEFLLEHRSRISDPLLLVFNSCEEGLGNLKGVRQIAADYEGRIASMISFDGSYNSLVDRAVGSERWEITAKTCGGHSYGAFGNPNAIVCLAHLVTRLSAQTVPQGAKTTYNVGTIEGGTSVNTIAQHARMTFEYRSDDAGCLQIMRSQFDSLLEEARSLPAEFSVTLLGERPCGSAVPADAQERLLARCGSAIASVTGNSPSRRASSTDANIPLSRGIPATTFGLYIGARSHTREEYIEIPSLQVGLEIGLTLMQQHLRA